MPPISARRWEKLPAGHVINMKFVGISSCSLSDLTVGGSNRPLTSS